jgi:hypothetical protein
MKVSFDFDSTLSRRDVQEFAKDLVKSNHEVWIVTSRYDNESMKNIKNFLGNKNQNDVLFKVADYCGIGRERIVFTCMRPKADFLMGKGFRFHLDDDQVEIEDILETGDPCVPIQVENPGWKQKCLDLIWTG